MPVNPITLDKIEPRIIQKIENQVIERVVHEINAIEIQNEIKKKKKNKFDKLIQEKASKKLVCFLSKDNIKSNYRVLDDKVNITLYDSQGNIIKDTYVDDVKELLNNLLNKGALLDKRV